MSTQIEPKKRAHLRHLARKWLVLMALRSNTCTAAKFNNRGEGNKRAAKTCEQLHISMRWMTGWGCEPGDGHKRGVDRR
jgi:hypothetical protein